MAKGGMGGAGMGRANKVKCAEQLRQTSGLLFWFNCEFCHELA